jgi:serine/threonine protein kinase
MSRAVTAVLLSRHTTIGAFRLKGHRGGGGFSDVYEAVDSDGKRVAVKILRSSGGGLETVTARFRREQELLEKLDSRRVARIIAADLDCPTPWIASEFVDGPNLREAIRENGPYTVETVLGLLDVLQKVLEELHQGGISHRDLSPNNILLGPDGPVVIDFGSARMDSNGQLGSVLSVGTPFYACPESIRGEEAGSPADLYSLARIIQFALTGMEDEEWSFRNAYGPSPIWRQLDACLLSDPSQRPQISELTVPQRLGALPVELTSAAYRADRVKVLPRRFSVAALSTTVLAVAAMVAIGTYLSVGRPDPPLTVDRLVELHPASKVSLEGKAVATSRGWIKSIPAFDGSNVQYVSPESLTKDLRFEALEAYHIFGDPNDQENILDIQISTEVIRDQLLIDLDEATATDSPLSDFPVVRSLMQDVIDDDIDLIPWRCSLNEATHLKREMYGDEISIVALVMSDPNCTDVFDREWTTFVEYRIFPSQNSALLIKARGHRHLIDYWGIRNLTSVMSADFIRDFPASATSLTGIGQSDFAAPISGFKSSYETPYLKRAWKLPAGRGLLLKLPETEETIPDISMLAIANPVDENWSGKLSDVVTPLGSLSSIRSGTEFRIANPSDWEWIVVFEIDDPYGAVSSIDFKLSDAGQLPIGSQMLTLDDFASGAQPVSGSFPSSGYAVASRGVNTKFLLPEYIPGFKSERPSTVEVDVGGVSLLVPQAWYQHPVETPLSGNFMALNRNSSQSFSINGLEPDVPQIEILDGSIAELTSRLGGEEWLATDRYKNCLGSRDFSKNDGKVFFEFRIFSMCAVPTSFSDGNNPKLRLQRAPIVEFQLSTKFFDAQWNSSWVSEVLRGRFVPRFKEDLIFWGHFVSHIEEQFQSIEQRELNKCKKVYATWVNHCERL